MKWEQGEQEINVITIPRQVGLIVESVQEDVVIIIKR